MIHSYLKYNISNLRKRNRQLAHASWRWGRLKREIRKGSDLDDHLHGAGSSVVSSTANIKRFDADRRFLRVIENLWNAGHFKTRAGADGEGGSIERRLCP